MWNILKRWLNSTRTSRLFVLNSLIIFHAYQPISAGSTRKVYRRETSTNRNEELVRKVFQSIPTKASAKQQDGGNAANEAFYETLVDESSKLAWINKSRVCELFHKVILILATILGIKSIILCLIDFDSFEEFRYLDCILVGRLLLNSRLTNETKYFAAFMSVHLIVWPILVGAKQKLSMPCFEFLLYNKKEIVVKELQHSLSQTRRDPSKLNRLNLVRPEHATSTVEFDSVLEYQDSLVTKSNGAEPAKAWQSFIRPNRSYESWLKLVTLVNTYYGYWLLFCLASLPSFILFQVPLMVTKVGFELNYSHCIKWISQQANRAQYCYIYDAPDNFTNSDHKRRLFLPFEELSTLNSYHLVRMICEYLESLFLLAIIANSFAAFGMVALLVSHDINHYCQLLRRQLVCFNRLLELQPTEYVLDRSLVYPTRESSEVMVNLRKLQASLIDLFRLIREYNNYIALATSYYILLWFLFSATITGWALLPGNNILDLEWYLLHLCSILFASVFVRTVASVRVSTRSLYQPIASANALNCNGQPERREIWLKILDYYSPNPMNCFTLFRSSEISYLFAFKIAVWLLSSLFVVSNFFRVYNNIATLTGRE